MPTAEQLARSRNLKTQLNELRNESDREIVFYETSPPKQYVTLYSRMDGEPLEIPMKLAERAMEKRLPDGTFMFTTDPADAPEYKQGTVKCFLHPESNERQSGMLDEVGLTGITCDAGKLANLYSKRVHAQHRHRQQWEAYQEAVSDQKNREYEDRQQKQLEATLALAGRAAGPVAVKAVPVEELPTAGLTAETLITRYDCPDCGWVNEKNTDIGLQMHQNRWCPSKEKADEVTE